MKLSSPFFAVVSIRPHGTTSLIVPTSPSSIRLRSSSPIPAWGTTPKNARGAAAGAFDWVVSVPESEQPTATIASTQAVAAAPRTALIRARLAGTRSGSAGEARKGR